MSHSVDSSPKIAVKFRGHLSTKSLKDHHLLKGKLSKRHLSKSTSALEHGTEASEPPSQQTTSSRPAIHQHVTVIQKTQAFFTNLKVRRRGIRKGCRNIDIDRFLSKLAEDGRFSSERIISALRQKQCFNEERWSKTKFRDKKGLESDSAPSDESPRKLCVQHELGYAADSSEHSSSVTPQSQSPFHKVLSHTTSSLSQRLANVYNANMNQLKVQNDCTTFKDCQNGNGNSNQLDFRDLPGCSKDANKDDYEQKIRESNLRQYTFFQLRVHLKCGKNLVAKDKSGTSDPYVKFKINGKLAYKSKTVYRDLNPLWDETFTLPIDDPFAPIHIKVFDYDWGLQDDFIGAAILDMTQFDLGRLYDLTLTLEDTKGTEHLGEIVLSATLLPKTQQDKEQFYQKTMKNQDAKRLKSQIWSSVVTIVLIKGSNLVSMDADGYSDPYVKFRHHVSLFMVQRYRWTMKRDTWCLKEFSSRSKFLYIRSLDHEEGHMVSERILVQKLGNEKYKSKVAYKTLNPKWLEQFDLHLFEDQSQELEITVWDKDWTSDDFMGRCSVALNDLEREKTHKITKELEEGHGVISLLLTISGTTSSETISDLANYEDNPKELENLKKRYALSRTFHNLRDVGHLTVKVFQAQGLASADICGKSDPFCVVELVNARLQTQTEYKTLTPSWQKIFTFNVKDIHSVLEITVYDEDKDHKVEFLGKVAIPLLKIQNNEKKWYALKDKKLRCRAKGNHAQILLEMNLIWNVARACIRTLNPKEEKYMQCEMKFKRQVFVRNVMRLKNVIMYFIEIGKFIQNCFEWESTIQSLIAFVIFILLCHYFQPYMAPIALLLIFAVCHIVQRFTGSCCGWNSADDDEEIVGEEDDDDDDKDKEEKKSLKERLQAVQEVTQTVQNSIGYIASLCESVKNTFNFTVPVVSYLAIVLLISITVVLYWIPIRYLIMMWGINKFSRKLLRPDTIPNNELLDLLSRVPDDEDLISYKELKPHSAIETERRSRKKAK